MMANAAKTPRMGRSALLIIVLLCYISARPDADLGGGVPGFFRSLEEAVEMKTLRFYRFFGANVRPNKLNLAKDCDYGDPNKIQFCPPALNPMIYANPNLPAGSSEKSRQGL
jgi:hypothetical protein